MDHSVLLLDRVKDMEQKAKAKEGWFGFMSGAKQGQEGGGVKGEKSEAARNQRESPTADRGDGQRDDDEEDDDHEEDDIKARLSKLKSAASGTATLPPSLVLVEMEMADEKIAATWQDESRLPCILLPTDPPPTFCHRHRHRPTHVSDRDMLAVQPRFCTGQRRKERLP